MNREWRMKALSAKDAKDYMDASALYEPPFSNMHGGGPDELFSGKENVIEGIFKKLEEVNTGVTSMAS
jgi:type I restriction enzyme R subunit